jgi:UPF0716 protein FxsA
MPFPPALIFLAFPLLELAGLIAAGRTFGVGPVLAWVFASAALGLFLLRAAGWATLRGMQASMQKGEVPLADMLSGAAMTFAAILLILPGFITDVLGLLLLIAPLRRFVAAGFCRDAAPPPSGPTVIEGEYSVVADPPPPSAPADPLPPPGKPG